MSKIYDKAYNEARHKRQREEVIRALGFRCHMCGAFRHPEFLEVLPREGKKFKTPSGGRFLHSMKRLRREVIPHAILVCTECRKANSPHGLGGRGGEEHL